MRAPLAAGTYIGEFVVTEDSNRCGDDPECADYESLVGATFSRAVTLREDCDSGSADCTISTESLAVFEALEGLESVEATWAWKQQDDDSWVATYTDSWIDDCVVPGTGEVVGDFDTAVTYTMVLRSPVSVDGSRVWGEAALTYVEDSISDDAEAGCYTSKYAAEGELARE